MKEVQAYLASDGCIFLNEDKCRKHQDDLIGKSLDELLNLYELDISRNQSFKAVLCCMKKRKELIYSLRGLLHQLEHE